MSYVRNLELVTFTQGLLSLIHFAHAVKEITEPEEEEAGERVKKE